MRLGRRRLLGAVAGFGAGMAASAAWAQVPPEPLELVDLTLPGDRKLARRCLLLVPRHAAATRLLVLCHGLGETIDERLGINAWPKAYGLLRAYERLLSPPLTRSAAGVRYFTDEHLARLNAELALQPFAGLALACPFTPNVYKAPSTALALDRCAAWIADVLLPELRQRLALKDDPANVGLDGVSLGGFVSLEVFLRRPESFGAVGLVQGAFREGVAELYARRLTAALEQVGPRPIRIATSQGDPFRAANHRLAERLTQRGANITFSLTPGPHSQLWLREVGSVELLHHYDRRLGSGQLPAFPRE